MPLIINKPDIPVKAYQPVKIGDEIAMSTITEAGVLYVFDDRCRLVTWPEIHALSLLEATEPDKVQEHVSTLPDKKPIREIPDPRKK